MIILYLLAGLNHFINPEFYIKIMPPWLPSPAALVLVSGIFEVVFALLLISPQTRKIGAWGIIVLLVAVFPANIQMLLNYMHSNDPKLWIAIARLPLQLLLIWWAYGFTKATKISSGTT